MLGDAASFSLPPLEFCRWYKPDPGCQVSARLGLQGSGTVATMALAQHRVATPSTSISRCWPISVDLALALTRRSFSRTCSFTSPNWQTSGAREAQATAGNTLITRVAPGWRSIAEGHCGQPEPPSRGTLPCGPRIAFDSCTRWRIRRSAAPGARPGFPAARSS